MSRSLLTGLRKLGKKKHRYESRQFVAEGLRTVEQILRSGRIPVDYLVFDESTALWEHEALRDAIAGIKTIQVDPKTFHELADTDTPQGVIAVCQMPDAAELSDFSAATGCLIALNRIQDPGNMGTIIRTAAWFGAAGLLLDDGTADLFHPKVVRSTAGATGLLPWWQGDLHEGLTALEAQGWSSWLLDAGESAVSLKDAAPGPKTIIVVGNEAAGLDERLKQTGRKLVHIPAGDSGAQVESLNASVALSIALYAFSR